MTRVAAVIVTYNADKQVDDCLGALSGLALDQIKVFDNASTDATVATVERFAAALNWSGKKLDCIRSSVNRGFGSGVNAAASGLDCDLLLLINPDCVLSPSTYKRMVDYLCFHPNVSAVGPGMVDVNGTRQIAGGAWPTVLKEIVSALRLDWLVAARARPWLGRVTRHQSGLRSLGCYLATLGDDGPVSVDWLCGFCLLIRMSTWQQIGGFDESFFLYYEDVDLCRRMRQCGGELVCLTDVTAIHVGSASSSEVGKQRYLAGGRRMYFEKHGARSQRLLARLVLPAR